VRLVGLTGGIGSGKSTVADLLRAKGAVVIDADAVARLVVEPGRPALAALAERFGSGILLPDGGLDRPGLAAIAFADDESRAALDAITWPAIADEFGRQIAESPPDAVVVCDVALLVESEWARNRPYRAIVVVEAPIDVRLDRLESRGLRRADAEQRMAAQVTDDERRAVATHVIDNGGDLASLQRQVDALWPELLALDPE
jgi:dephospho-CoA kinase